MLYIWSYLKKYPKWLALNLFSAVLFVIVNLGLPTILARMIDEGINPRDVNRLYFWGWVMFAIILLGIVGRIIVIGHSLDFGCLCFDAVCGFYVEDGGHHTLDDGFQCSLDSDN